MSTQAIEIREQSEKLTVTSEQMTLARQTVAKDLDDNQFALFCYNCQRLGVHPLDGLLVPIVRNDREAGEKRLTFVNTVDLLRSRAAESGDYAGSDDATFEYQLKDQNYPSDARVTVWKLVQSEKCSFSATARWEEYYPGEKQGFMWRNKPHVMLGKCAEALALRKAFPKQLAGLYIPEELQKEIERPSGKAPQKQATAKRESNLDVMCSECRQVNGHKPDCPHNKQCSECHGPNGKHATTCSRKGVVAEATVPQEPEKAVEAPETPAAPSELKPGQEKMILRVLDVQPWTKGNLSKLNIRVEDNDMNEWELSCWHKSLTEKLNTAKGELCVFVVEKKSKAGHEYYNLEQILAIGATEYPQ